jgi:hypothetical protein
MHMPLVAILFGALLDAIGIGAYVSTGAQSVTALIPSFFGTLLLVCGVVAAVQPKARKHAMHVAAVVGLVATLGGLGMGLPKLGTLLAGTAERPVAILLQLSMGVLAAIFLALCVNSFIQARKARKAGGESRV